MSTNAPSAAATSPRPWLRWAVLTTAVLIGVGAGLAVAILHGSRASTDTVLTPLSRPDAVWPAGARLAPDFRLRDQGGRPISLHSLRGRPVILTFIDPLCRNLCPLEAQVLTHVVRQLAPLARPALVAVSVNPGADTPANLRLDVQKWRLTPSWRWALGPPSRLAVVWRDYQIGVRVTKVVIAGVAVREVAHTEAAYVIDSRGYQRALYVYPFRADDMASTVRTLARRRAPTGRPS
jgi:cytochrome oxidase Cu insertion factor (SCO1/SenC/PrrC family)